MNLDSHSESVGDSNRDPTMDREEGEGADDRRH